MSSLWSGDRTGFACRLRLRGSAILKSGTRRPEHEALSFSLGASRFTLTGVDPRSRERQNKTDLLITSHRHAVSVLFAYNLSR